IFASREIESGAALRAKEISALRSVIRYWSSEATLGYGVLASCACACQDALSNTTSTKAFNIIFSAIFGFMDRSCKDEIRSGACAGRPGRRLDCYLVVAAPSALRGLLHLAPHLLHELAHFSDVTRRAFLHPDLKALRGLLHMREELLIGPLISPFRDSWLDPLPDPEEFTASFEEQVLVKQTVVQQSAGLLPVADHHHEVGASFCPGRGDSHRIVPVVCEVALEEPVASLPKPGLAALFKDLQAELCLFVR